MISVHALRCTLLSGRLTRLLLYRLDLRALSWQSHVPDALPSQAAYDNILLALCTDEIKLTTQSTYVSAVQPSYVGELGSLRELPLSGQAGLQADMEASYCLGTFAAAQANVASELACIPCKLTAKVQTSTLWGYWQSCCYSNMQQRWHQCIHGAISISCQLAWPVITKDLHSGM